MIYTVTMNPSLDYWMAVPQMLVGDTNRAAKTGLSYGGKGLNVSATLHKLGMPSVAVALLAGWTGEALARYARAVGFHTDFIMAQDADALTRINVKIRGEDTTEVNAPGYAPTAQELEAVTSRLARLGQGDVAVLSGSLPPRVPASFYRDTVRVLKDKGVRTVVDCDGEALALALEAKPFLVKPNRKELENWIGRALPLEQDVPAAARQMQAAGAERVLVSLGEDGALLLDEDGAIYRTPALRGEVLQTVGAGDAMLAGFLYGYETSGADATEALRWGSAAGAATVFGGAEATGEDIRRLYADLNG